MRELNFYQEQLTKMEDLCEAHGLTSRFQDVDYPLTLIIRPAAGTLDQMDLLAETDEGRISPDASLVFYKADGEIYQKITGGLTISETLLAKFRNIFKKITDFYLQYFFRVVMEQQREQQIQGRRAFPVSVGEALPNGDEADPV